MRSRLPAGFVSLVVCDTRRAHAWRDALRRRGFQVELVETAADHAQGGWEVGVDAASALAARAFVSEVARGETTLEGARRRVGPIVLAIVVLAILAAAVVASNHP